jgi:purine-nucleoside phosphorylase
MNLATNDSPYAMFVDQAKGSPPVAALIFGSGMGGLTERCQAVGQLPFTEVPGLSATAIAGHRGYLTLGDWADKRVVLFEGRLHYYEGHPWHCVIQPMHIAHSLGARVVLLTNAAGGIGDAQEPGSLMALRDHIEWTWPYCWRRPGPGGLGGPRDSPYSPRLREALELAAQDRDIELHTGIYAAVTGPCYETPAEIRALKQWGADAVGMSTAREVQAGHELGLECAAVSCITNRAAGMSTKPINHEEVLLTAAAQSERLADLLEGFLLRL